MNACGRAYHCSVCPILLVLFLVAAAVPVWAGVIEGVISDSATGEPVPRVTIRVENEGRAMLGNDDGRYRLRLDPGTHRIRFSHVAHYPAEIEITVGDSTIVHDISLQSCLIELPASRVYSRAYDPAQEIIVEAIRHKEELLSKIKDYRFAGYTKLTARKLKDGRPDEYYALIETQLEGWFRQPDRYKEIITARRQSVNIAAEMNVITIGEIFNFNANRIDLGRPVVSPTATDALDYYNYYLLDTILVDGVPAFLLEVEPKTDAHALFVGRIMIVDSVYAVAGVDLGLNDGFDAPYITDLRFTQRLARFENDIWMPVEITFAGRFQSPVPIIPDLDFAYTGVLNHLVINQGIPDNRFDQYVLEVDSEADKVDSTAWDAGALVPLTEAERDGYRHIDSLKHRPLNITRALGFGMATLMAATASPRAHPFFHFNRVEGPYLGAGVDLKSLVPRSELLLKSGFAFDGEYWQHRYRVQTLLHDPTQLKVAINYHNEIVARPNIYGDENINSTFSNLFFKYDPLDYYLEEGFDLNVSLRALPHISMGLAYHDLNQSTADTVTNYSVTGIDDPYRANPAIIDGHLRSLSAGLTYDSRPLARIKGREQALFELPFSSLRLSFEMAEPDLIDSDFRFRRYSLSLYRVQALSGWGFTSLRAYLGGSDRLLPPQRHFSVPLESPYESELQFKTLSDFNFTGDRVAAFYLSHSFGASLFRRLHIPLLKELPFGLTVFGGAFWTDFRAATLASFPPTSPGPVESGPLARLEQPAAAPDWYSEIGFGVSRLPLLVRLLFTWQLSAYDADRFSFKFAMGL